MKRCPNCDCVFLTEEASPAAALVAFVGAFKFLLDEEEAAHHQAASQFMMSAVRDGWEFLVRGVPAPPPGKRGLSPRTFDTIVEANHLKHGTFQAVNECVSCALADMVVALRPFFKQQMDA